MKKFSNWEVYSMAFDRRLPPGGYLAWDNANLGKRDCAGVREYNKDALSEHGTFR